MDTTSSLPRGFLWGAVRAGIKPSGRADLSAIIAPQTATAAALFTTNKIRMHAPDNVDPGAAYGDSKLQMDSILKGYTLRRAIGTDSIRLTSLGPAKIDSTCTVRTVCPII